MEVEKIASYLIIFFSAIIIGTFIIGAVLSNANPILWTAITTFILLLGVLVNYYTVVD